MTLSNTLKAVTVAAPLVALGGVAVDRVYESPYADHRRNMETVLACVANPPNHLDIVQQEYWGSRSMGSFMEPGKVYVNKSYQRVTINGPFGYQKINSGDDNFKITQGRMHDSNHASYEVRYSPGDDVSNVSPNVFNNKPWLSPQDIIDARDGYRHTVSKAAQNCDLANGKMGVRGTVRLALDGLERGGPALLLFGINPKN